MRIERWSNNSLIAVSAAVSTLRGSQESLWERRSAGGSNPDGGSEDAHVLLDSPDSNGISGTSEEERSPVEESGREVEVAAEGEELGSAVEEGEEAALALDVLASEPQQPWPQAKHLQEDINQPLLAPPSTEESSPKRPEPEGPLPL